MKTFLTCAALLAAFSVWSRWRVWERAAMEGMPHEQTPDLSNLLKAYEDALLPQDCAVWDYAGLTKRWALDGSILVEVP